MTTARIEQDAVLTDRGRPSFLDYGDELIASSVSRQPGPYKAMPVQAQSEVGSRFIPDAASITYVTCLPPRQTQIVHTWPSPVWTVQVNAETPATPSETPLDAESLATITCQYALFVAGIGSQNFTIGRRQTAHPYQHFTNVRITGVGSEASLFQEPSDSRPIADSWLSEALELEAAGRSEEALDIIFGTFDDWLLDGNFAQCSTFLNTVSVDKLETSHLLTILTATLPARKKLPDRSSFFRRVRITLEQRGEDAESLLSGLEG